MISLTQMRIFPNLESNNKWVNGQLKETKTSMVEESKNVETGEMEKISIVGNVGYSSSNFIAIKGE